MTEWLAWLIGHGHLFAKKYGMNFFMECVSQSYAERQELVASVAFGMRASNMKDSDFEPFLNEFLYGLRKKIKVDHNEAMKRFGATLHQGG